MNILDLIIVIILLLGAWDGFRRGLILTSGGLLGFLGGIWLAGRNYIAAAHFLGTQLGLDRLLARILTPFTTGIQSAIPVMATRSPGAAAGFPQSLWEPVRSASAGIHGGDLALSLAEAIVKVIAFLLIMAAVSCLAMMLASLVSRVARLLLLGGFDRLGGVGLGMVTRALELVVIVGLLTPVVLGLSLGAPDHGGFLQSFFQAWNRSALIPLLNNAWNGVAPALKEIFLTV